MNLKAGDTVTLEHDDGSVIKKATVLTIGHDVTFRPSGQLYIAVPNVGPLYITRGAPPLGWRITEHEPTLEDGAYVKPGETFVYYILTNGVWHKISRGSAERIGVIQPDGRLVRLEAPETTRAKVLFEIVDWLKSSGHPVMRGNDILASRLLDKFLHEKKDA